MIQGETVRLRAIERDDIPRFLRWMNDREVTQYLLINSPLSKAMEEKWFDRQVDIPIHQGQVLAIEVMAGDIWVHIGNTGLHDVDPVSRNAEFGIVIGEKEYWNTQRVQREGVEIAPGVQKNLNTLAKELGLPDNNLGFG